MYLVTADAGDRRWARKTPHSELWRDSGNAKPEMDTGHFFGPGSDPTHKRPTRNLTRPAKIVYNLTHDRTRPDFLQMQCVTLQTTFFAIKKQRCAKYRKYTSI